jgi:hypothetical protein
MICLHQIRKYINWVVSWVVKTNWHFSLKSVIGKSIDKL